MPSRKEIDWDLFDKMCQYKVSLVDAAQMLNVSDRTLQTRIREKENITFFEYRDKRMAKTRLTLQQRAVQMAMEGSHVMMIFCLKNLCGWADKQEVNHNTGEIKIEIDNDDKNL